MSKARTGRYCSLRRSAKVAAYGQYRAAGLYIYLSRMGATACCLDSACPYIGKSRRTILPLNRDRRHCRHYCSSISDQSHNVEAGRAGLEPASSCFLCGRHKSCRMVFRVSCSRRLPWQHISLSHSRGPCRMGPKPPSRCHCCCEGAHCQEASSAESFAAGA